MAAISESTASETAASSTTKSAAEEAGRALASAGPVTKLIVAIHGIGDQYRYATIRSVVTRFGRHFDFPAATPLGSFYAPDGSISAFRLPAPPDPPGGLGGIGFAEVYWADIPRAIQKKGYTIEEAKAWAGTVVERIRARYGPELKKQFDFQSEDFRDAANVLLEMIETIKILANLLFLAEKMGFPKFDLDDLLTSYLGDVQLVADFPAKRQKILQRFSDVLDALWKGVLLKQESKPEIYIVAHSEGTVIAFMALLRAMSLPTRGEVAPPPRPEWIDQVRGFMTIGSPIDKHLILWPSVWDAYNTPGPPVNPPIRWRNYYDYGDPVGFDLDTARDWMKDHRWNPAFEFEQKDDFGFSRYPLPGAAHNDYWSDEVVFGHFIQTVVGAPPALGCDFTAPKWNRNLARIFSYVSPYLLAFLLLYGGTCLLAKALQAYAAPAPAPHPATSAAAAPAANTLRGKPYVVQWWYKVQTEDQSMISLGGAILNGIGISCLLAGTTMAARIPRLTRKTGWRLLAAALFVLFAVPYVLLVDARTRCWLGFYRGPSGVTVEEAWVPTIVTLLLALGVVLFSMLSWHLRHPPVWLAPLLRGARPLTVPGSVAILLIIAYRVRFEYSEDNSLWPLLLSSGIFLYLWWLAIRLFDLIFIWHRYTRHAVLQRYLGKMRPARKEREKSTRPDETPATG